MMAKISFELFNMYAHAYTVSHAYVHAILSSF